MKGLELVQWALFHWDPSPVPVIWASWQRLWAINPYIQMTNIRVLPTQTSLSTRSVGKSVTPCVQGLYTVRSIEIVRKTSKWRRVRCHKWQTFGDYLLKSHTFSWFLETWNIEHFSPVSNIFFLTPRARQNGSNYMAQFVPGSLCEMLAALISILTLEKHFERQSDRKVSVTEKNSEKNQTQQIADRKVSDRCSDGRDHLLHSDSNCPSCLQEDTMAAIDRDSLSLACCLQRTLTVKVNKLPPLPPRPALVSSLKITYLFCRSQDQTKKSVLLISPSALVDTHSLELIFASALIHWEMRTFIYLFWDTVLVWSPGWPGAQRPANLCFLAARIKVCVTTPGLKCRNFPKTCWHKNIKRLCAVCDRTIQVTETGKVCKWEQETWFTSI